MNDKDRRALRVHAINELLIAHMKKIITAEVSKLIEAGAPRDQVDEALTTIIFVWDHWREEMLQRCMAQFDDDQPMHPDNVTPLRPMN